VPGRRTPRPGIYDTVARLVARMFALDDWAIPARGERGPGSPSPISGGQAPRPPADGASPPGPPTGAQVVGSGRLCRNAGRDRPVLFLGAKPPDPRPTGLRPPDPPRVPKLSGLVAFVGTRAGIAQSYFWGPSPQT